VCLRQPWAFAATSSAATSPKVLRSAKLVFRGWFPGRVGVTSARGGMGFSMVAWRTALGGLRHAASERARNVVTGLTVTLAVKGDQIVALGSAPSTWIERAHTADRLLPAGGPSFDVSEVRDIYEEEIGKLREAIQSHEIRFNYNDSLPAPGQDPILDELASQLKELEALSSRLHATTRVTLTGHSDNTGRGTFNISLSLARSEAAVRS
jgi:outer membrane protein OmpA-like peptidoglycan-associated protein